MADLAALDEDFGEDHPALRKTLTECTDVAEWLGALAQHPGAFGLSKEAQVGLIEVQVACTGSNEELPVCVDAVTRGYI